MENSQSLSRSVDVLQLRGETGFPRRNSKQVFPSKCLMVPLLCLIRGTHEIPSELDPNYRLNPAVSIFCLLQGLEAVKRICPKQVMLIGMGHVFDRHVDNGFLNQWSIRNVINNT
ncbi:hypothetical protein SDJN03_21454, partial [Cucurbita argyrosperma subsp. sororia]